MDTIIQSFSHSRDMKNSKRIKLIIILLHFHSMYCENQNEDKRKNSLYSHGFGPYESNVRAVENCLPYGKLDKESAALNVTLQAYRVNRSTQELRGSYTYKNDVEFHKILLLVEAQRSGGTFTLEYKKMIEKPCENIIFGPVLQMTIHPDEFCRVKKGTYKMDHINVDSMIHIAFPDMQYNTYKFQMEWYSKNGVLGCAKIMADIKPIRRNIKKNN